MYNVGSVFINILNIQQTIYVNQVSAFGLKFHISLTWQPFFKTLPLKSNSSHTFYY